MNRTLVAFFLAVALVAGAAGGLASRFWNAPPVFAQESPKSVSAQSFILVNSAGERRGILNVTRDGSVLLRLYDDGGTPRIEMGIPAAGTNITPGYPDIRLLGPDGRTTWSAHGGVLPLRKDAY